MRAILAAAILTAWASAASAQATDRTIQLQFHEDGTVTLSARNVSTSDVLQAWAAECGCFVVNGNRLTASVIETPILFEHASQAVVLRSLLKQAGGFVLTPRRAGAKGPSDYETIYIVPTSAPSPFIASSGPIAFQPMQNPTAGAPDDEIAPVTPIRIPEPVDPTAGANPPPEPSAPAPASPMPSGMSVPGVRVVPITPVPSTPPPASQPTPPARNP